MTRCWLGWTSKVGGHELLAALVAVLLFAAPSAGQGFGIYEQGGCAMGRAGAAVAAPCGDGSAIFFNPAALVEMDHDVVSVGGTGIFTDGGFRPDGGAGRSDLDNRMVPVGHAYLALQRGDYWAFGVGLYAPYGLETKWPLDFEGRFVGYDNALRTVYAQPTVAWMPVHGISFGAGLNLVWSEVQLNRRLDLATTPVPPTFPVPPGTTFGDLGVPAGTDFADSRLEGGSDGLGVGGQLALLVDLDTDLRLGVRYLFETEVEYDGDADFQQIPTGITLTPDNPFGQPAGTPLDAVLEGAGLFAEGPLADRGVRTSITMPNHLVVGLGWDVNERVVLSADYQWTDWSDFDRIVLDFEGPEEEVLAEDFENTSGVRVGADVELTPTWSVRAGYFWNEAASPDETVTPILPEAERNSLTAGIGWRSGPFVVDAAYMYLGQEDRRGRVRGPAPGQAPTTALNSGLYTFEGHLVGLTLTLGL